MLGSRGFLAVIVGLLLAGTVGCAPAPPPSDPVALTTNWREQAAQRVEDLTYPGRFHPQVTGPIDPDPTLYADAVRLLATAGILPAAGRDRATTLMVAWWPATDADGIRWLALVRALGVLGTLDRLPAARLGPALRWVRTMLTAPPGRPEDARRVMVAGRLAAALHDAAPDDPDLADLPDLVRRAAIRLPCASARTLPASTTAAAMAAAAGQVCRVPTAAAVAARRRLAETGTGFQPGNRVAWAADLSPLAAVGVVDSNAFLDGAADILAMLGGPEHRRGGLLGQSAVVIVADAITGAGGRYLLPPVQVDNLERVVRSESRLPDAVADGDPLDTALAVDLLRRLGRSAPGPVSWDAPLDLGTRAVLALALDHRQLPTAEAVARALVEQPADAIPVGYLTAAHPGLCLPRVSDLRADYATTPDLRTWTSDRLFEAAILVSTTAGCGGADQQALTGTLTGALDRLQQAPMTGPTSAASPAPVPLVENWYLAEAGCLLGQPTRYLLKVADLRRSVQREVGSERIRSEVTVRQLYAAVRLAELRADPGSCANTWWAAGLRR